MHKQASFILGIGILLASGAAIVVALDWPWKAKLFPIAIGIPVFCMAVVEVLWGLLGPAARGEAMEFQLSDQIPARTVARRTLAAIAWMFGFLAAIALLGFPVAVPLFVFLYLIVQGKERWMFCAVFAGAAWAIFYAVFDRLLHLPFPAGLVQGWLGL